MSNASLTPLPEREGLGVGSGLFPTLAHVARPTPDPSPAGEGRRALLLALLLLAACGKQGKLTPIAPRPAPVQPANSPRPVTPEERLKLAPQAQPTRVDDPVRRSEERPDDRFNLPPPGRG